MRIGHPKTNSVSGVVALVLFGALCLPAFAITREQETKELIQIRKALDAFDFKKAYALSDALIKKAPNSFNAYLSRGKAWGGLGNNTAAMKDAKRSIELNPTFKEAYAFKGDLMRYRQDIRGAVAAYERVFVLDPCNDEIVLELRQLYAKIGLDSKHYQDALSGNPLRKAVTLEKSGKTKEALKIYNEYIKANPLARTAYEYRGNLYFFNKDYKNALADYLKAVDLFPASAQNYTSVGRCYDGLGDGANSCKYFEQAISLSPTSLGYLYAYGSVLYKYKKYEKGIELYSRLLKQEPDNSDAFRIRGDCHLALKHYKEALADYTEALDTSPFASPDTYRQRARVYDAMKMPEKAKRDRAKAEELLK